MGNCLIGDTLESADSKKNRPLALEINKAPQAQQRDQFGMMYDRDALGLYGDPLWDARFDPALQQSPVTWKWDESAAGALTLTVAAARDYSFDAFPVLLPHRLKHPQVQMGQELNPVANDKFVLIPKAKFEKGHSYVVKLAPAPETAAAKQAIPR